MLKAYLVLRKIEFEKVHDLGYLLDQCTEADAAFESLRDAVEPLTVFAVTFRYPGPADPTQQDVESAARAVEQVRQFVTQRLPSEVLP